MGLVKEMLPSSETVPSLDLAAHYRTLESAGHVQLRIADSSRLFIASDYGGEHDESDYATYPFLVFTETSFQRWRRACQNVRSRFLKDKRRMAYKKLGDGVRCDALLPFLGAADQLKGI